MLDVDKNGYLDHAELGLAMRSFGRECGEEDIHNLIKKGDRQHKGKLNEKDFTVMMRKLLREKREEAFPHRKREIRKVFKAADVSGTGTLSPRKFQSFIHDLGVDLTKKETQAIVSAIDKDGDGKVSLSEFEVLVQLVNKGRAKSLSAAARAAIAKIARGPLQDPTEYLRNFIGLPSHFRPSICTRRRRDTGTV